MEGWARFWMVVVFGSLGVFTLLSAWVSIAGLRDIRRMLDALARDEDEPDEDER